MYIAMYKYSKKTSFAKDPVPTDLYIYILPSSGLRCALTKCPKCLDREYLNPLLLFVSSARSSLRIGVVCLVRQLKLLQYHTCNWLLDSKFVNFHIWLDPTSSSITTCHWLLQLEASSVPRWPYTRSDVLKLCCLCWLLTFLFWAETSKSEWISDRILHSAHCS